MGVAPNGWFIVEQHFFFMSDDWESRASRGALVQFQGSPEVFMRSFDHQLVGGL